MTKRRKRRKRKQRPFTNTGAEAPIPVTRRFGKITEADRLFSLLHKGIPTPEHAKENNLLPDQKITLTIRNIAQWAVNTYNCNFLAAAEDFTPKENNWNWATCQSIYNNFDYKKMGTIHLHQGRYIEPGALKKGIFITDGVHRCVSLASLILQDKIEFQPFPVEIDFYGNDANHR